MLIFTLILLLTNSIHKGSAAAEFSCKGRPPGYYALVSSGCHNYRLCTGDKEWTYSCPGGTLFQQRMLVCDHEHQVNCQDSPTYFDLSSNQLIPQQHGPKESKSGYIQEKTTIKHAPSITTEQPVELKPFNKLVKPQTLIYVTISPILDITHTKPTTANELSKRNVQEYVREAKSSRTRLEWTLPDVRAMLYIPDDPRDVVLPNIKRYSVTIPVKPRDTINMQFRNNTEDEGATTSCPPQCDVRYLKPGSCQPCLIVR